MLCGSTNAEAGASLPFRKKEFMVDWFMYEAHMLNNHHIIYWEIDYIIVDKTLTIPSLVSDKYANCHNISDKSSIDHFHMNMICLFGVASLRQSITYSLSRSLQQHILVMPCLEITQNRMYLLGATTPSIPNK